MPWKYGSVTLKEGKSWTDDNGIKHPTNWTVWTETYKKNVIIEKISDAKTKSFR